ncbi:MAG: hypothetical protein IT260_14805 [Saprospiraceae bacterium]|nr:hypothetical protein [Saprospiraceae bacterium]
MLQLFPDYTFTLDIPFSPEQAARQVAEQTKGDDKPFSSLLDGEVICLERNVIQKHATDSVVFLTLDGHSATDRCYVRGRMQIKPAANFMVLIAAGLSVFSILKAALFPTRNEEALWITLVFSAVVVGVLYGAFWYSFRMGCRHNRALVGRIFNSPM